MVLLNIPSFAGPIISVSPGELHSRDPKFYATICDGGGRRVNKDPDAVAAFAVSPAVSQR